MTPPTRAHSEFADESLGEPISLSHFFRTIRAYKAVILLILCAAAIAYALIAMIAYLASPTERVTSQQFRLDFEGASNGKFPNGLRFTTADVVNSSILLQVYRGNELQRYATYPNFSRAVFVLESNRALEMLAAEYQSRLADPKLSSVDRERVQKEFEQKRDAIAKNEYSLNFVRFEDVKKIPEPIVRKVLTDILNAWSDYAVKGQDVLAYRIVVLSPQILAPTEAEKNDPMMAVQLLRSRIVRLLDNVKALQRLPGAELARGGADRMSLEEVRIRMEEIQRYEVEPLVSRIRASGTTTPLSLRFLQDQLDYDQRQLSAAKKRADSLRETLATYQQTLEAPTTSASGSSTPASGRGLSSDASGGETVMPQVSDTFIDRVIDLVSSSADAQYRQLIVNDYRGALEAMIPIEQTVAYETTLLNDLRSGTAAGPPVDAKTIATEIETSRNELRVLVTGMNDIYREISRSVYSTSQLVAMTAPASTRVQRGIDVKKLMLWGVVVLLLTLPLAVIGCLLHNRVREEEAEGEMAHSDATA